jgi:hypothetical protein
VPKWTLHNTLGFEVIGWCMDWVLQPDGPKARDPWEFTDEQAMMVLEWYAIDSKGAFIYRRGVIRRMKGWGKDPLIAVLCLAEACGPVMFDYFDADGTARGKQHPAPLVQVGAVAKEQTKNTMTLLPAMMGSPGSKFRTVYQIDAGKEIVYVRSGLGRIEAVTSSPSTLEGARSTFVVLNETHHWIKTNAGHDMADVIRRNTSKGRDGGGRSLEITNAHLPGEDSVAERTYVAHQKGALKGVWYDSLESPPIGDCTSPCTRKHCIHDEKLVKAGLTIARGGSYWVNVDRLYEEIQDPSTPAYISRRFYLNQVIAVDLDRWLPVGAWAPLARPGLTIPDGARVVIGFDGSYNGDATGITAVNVDGSPKLVQTIGCWERPTELKSNETYRIPREEVLAVLRKCFSRWRVIELCVDPALWQSDLESLLDSGFPVVEFTQRGQRMFDATQRAYELATTPDPPGLIHDGNPDLTRHVGNAVVKVDSRGPRLVKVHERSVQHIDLAVSMVMALQRAYEIELEAEFATALFAKDFVEQVDETAQAREPREPKIITQADYTIPNQFNIGPKR